MRNNPLSPSSLLQIIDKSLKAAEGSSTDQTLRNPYDAIAVFVHACMLAIGARLIGFDEEEKLESTIDATTEKPLPTVWNNSNSYSFRYAHEQSSLEFLIKISRLGNKVVIFGVGVGDDKTASFDIVTSDYTSGSFFPYTSGDDVGDEESGGQRRRLRDGYISESRMSDLASLVKINILQKLLPGLHKPGYQEESAVASSSSSSAAPNRPRPDDHDPLRMPPPHFEPPNPYRPYNPPPIPAGGERPPGFDDEYDILRPPRSGPFMGPGNPLSIGEDDLNPPGLGRNPPIRGPFFGEGGIPRPGFGGGGGMGGMHPTPDHPMFGGRGDGSGLREYDPRFPPGARYDPVGPGDAPRGGLHGPRGPGWGGGPGGNPFGGFGGGDFI